MAKKIHYDQQGIWKRWTFYRRRSSKETGNSLL